MDRGGVNLTLAEGSQLMARFYDVVSGKFLYFRAVGYKMIVP